MQQEPSESLNPACTLSAVLREASPQADAAVLEKVGLAKEWMRRKVSELSEGQRSRVAIARAVSAAGEGLLILDESLACLDPATVQSVVAYIPEAQRESGMACLVISHRLDHVRCFAHRVLTMRSGVIEGPAPACILQIVAISVIGVFCVQRRARRFLFRPTPEPAIERTVAGAVEGGERTRQAVAERYSMWVRSALRGEMGTSLAYGVPVMMLIAPRISRTAAILLPSLLLGWTLGLAMALWAARRRDRLLEPTMSIAGMSPEVILISVLLWIAVYTGAPLTGAWLPITGLACIIVPLVFLHAFGTFLAARDAVFVRIAESRGVRPWRLWTRFVLPAASNPLISLLGPSLATAIGSSLVVEAMTGWPGLGPLFLEAVQARDYEVVQAVIVLMAVALTATNFVADLLLYWLDPRIRLTA